MTQWLLAGLALGVGVLVLRRRGGGAIVDRRSYAQPTAYMEEHSRDRDPESVYALVLHQMGFSRGSDPGRYNKINAHYIVLPDGGLYQLHDHAVRLPASSGLNDGSVAVEFAGNFPSRPRSTESRHFWSPQAMGMDQLTGPQIQAGRALVAQLRGQGLTHVLGHRQGGGGRENDPGPDVWREIGAWAVRQYGLEWGGPDFAVGSGMPIPDRWWEI